VDGEPSAMTGKVLKIVGEMKWGVITREEWIFTMAREDERDGGHHSKRRKHSHGERDDRERGKGLPFHARELTKEDMDEYRGVFAKYLKDRKDIHIDDVSSTEAYARFKSFVHKWFCL
jgi:hypothetical protein